jgi:hypothetical protein
MLNTDVNRPNPNPAIQILYVLALPDWKPNEVTPFQGFRTSPPLVFPIDGDDLPLSS